MYENITRQLAESVNNIDYDQLPKEIVLKVKYVLLDSIGCALGGYITDRARIGMELIEEWGGKPQATIIGSHRTSCPLAAFCNSELMNALDYDHCGPLAGHVGPFVTPACLAIAERQHASGKDLILSVAIANEVGGRAMASVAQHKVLTDEPPYYKTHPRFSYSTSIFGGVAGGGKLLGFDVEHMTNGFGIAGASTPVPATMKWQYMYGPAIMSKYNAWTGWVAQLATVSVLAAEKGFTGDRTILDGEWGYWNIVGSPFFKADNLLKGLGEVWQVNEVQFKKHPTCYLYSAAIDGIRQLVIEHDIKPEDIEKIVVKGGPLMQMPNRSGIVVTNFADAQFFIRYNFALAVFYGDQPSPAWQMPSTFRDPRITDLVKKVELDVHPNFDEVATEKIKQGKIPVMLGAIVEIRAKGKDYTTEVSAPKGSKEDPFEEKDFIEKFRANASYSMLKTSKTEKVVEMVLHLDEIDDIGKVFELMAL